MCDHFIIYALSSLPRVSNQYNYIDKLLYAVFIIITEHDYNKTVDQYHIGYEPADLTVHPPPRTAEGGFIFFV